jgi:hypothetical protein
MQSAAGRSVDLEIELVAGQFYELGYRPLGLRGRACFFALRVVFVLFFRTLSLFFASCQSDLCWPVLFLTCCSTGFVERELYAPYWKGK